MTDIFISYARGTADQAHRVAEALRGLGYGVWRDDELPAHRAYAEVIEERLKAAKAVVVIWSAEAAKSEWVRSEADRARGDHKLVQLRVDGAQLPMPFDQIQCADLAGWSGDTHAPGWRKVVASLGELMGAIPPPAVEAPTLALPSKPSIAVMPFANLSGDPEQEYFADGMVVEIVESLSRCRSIFVIASGSSLSFKGKGVNAQEAARQLGVRYILEGSVRKAGNRVRIGVQLIDAAESLPIWTERFEDTLEDVFDLQDKVALAVAGKIEPTVEAAEIRRASVRPTESLGSYDLYLRALPRLRTFVQDKVLEALDLLNRAIALDPDFGPALGLAAHCQRAIYTRAWSDDPQGARRRALELAQRALKVAGDDAKVLARVANVLAYLGEDPEAAVALADRAIALDPGSSLAWHLSGVVQLRIGRLDLAIDHTERAMRLDPMSPERPLEIGFIGEARFQQGRFSDAIGPLREADRHMDTPYSLAVLAACLGQLGQIREAQAALARYCILTSQPIAEMAGAYMRDPAHLKLFLDGIALAEGGGPD